MQSVLERLDTFEFAHFRCGALLNKVTERNQSLTCRDFYIAGLFQIAVL